MPLEARGQSESQPEASIENQIVVEGKHYDSLETAREVRAIATTQDGQLARFHSPICPAVNGLPEDYATIVESEIRNLAERGGLNVGDEGCKPNLTLIVAPSGTDLIDELKKQRPELLQALSLLEFDRLRSSSGPAWSWQSTEPTRADGGPVEYISELQIESKVTHLPKGSYQVRGANLGRLTQPTRQNLNLSFIVIERSAIEGMTLQQLGDFAAIAGLTAVKLNGTEKLGYASILSVFSDKRAGLEPETSATEFDLAYLKAFYSGSPGKTAQQAIKFIASSVEKDLSNSDD
ncbi:MAG: hypothetical protein WC889_01310 [Myxococcota bacterium]